MSDAWLLAAAAALSARVPVVLREPVVPARLLALAHLPVQPPVPQELQLPALVPLVLADLVVEPVAAVERLLGLLRRQSCSAAMARSSP
jgi:hypothetical protein